MCVPEDGRSGSDHLASRGTCRGLPGTHNLQVLCGSHSGQGRPKQAQHCPHAPVPRIKGQCHTLDAVLEKTEEPGRYTACEY